MQVSGIEGGNAGTGQVKAAQTTDSVSRNIMNQIANVQKQIQELSSNKEMEMEEKMKKRQELQQQVFELQGQLRQHEIELRKEAAEGNGTSMEDMLGGARQEDAAAEAGVSVSFSASGMQAMISADAAMSQAKVQGSTARSLNGRAGILETEIKLDGGRGVGTEMKQRELASIEQKASQASASQVKSLSGAVNALKDAAKEEGRKDSVKQEEPVGTKGENSNTETEDLLQNAAEISPETQSMEMSMSEKYNPVDILL